VPLPGLTASTSFTLVPAVGFFLVNTTGDQSWLKPDMALHQSTVGVGETVLAVGLHSAHVITSRTLDM
jgi:hypothetical protein